VIFLSIFLLFQFSIILFNQSLPFLSPIYAITIVISILRATAYSCLPQYHLFSLLPDGRYLVKKKFRTGPRKLGRKNIRGRKMPKVAEQRRTN
jgi:hypothetical protein